MRRCTGVLIIEVVVYLSAVRKHQRRGPVFRRFPRSRNPRSVTGARLRKVSGGVNRREREKRWGRNVAGRQAREKRIPFTASAVGSKSSGGLSTFAARTRKGASRVESECGSARAEPPVDGRLEARYPGGARGHGSATGSGSLTTPRSKDATSCAERIGTPGSCTLQLLARAEANRRYDLSGNSGSCETP